MKLNMVNNMKKKLFFMVSMLFCVFATSAQIKMISDGSVGIGEFWGGNPRQPFDVNVESYFSCYPASSGFYFTYYGSQPMILPQWTGALFLGRSDRQLWRIYTRYLHVNGVMVTSDEKIKENIRPLTGSLNNILKLNPIKYDYKESIYPADSVCYNRENLIKSRKDYSGFLAQDVQTIFPKYVEYNEDSDILEINYLGFVPELVNAIKEQQKIIESLQQEIKNLKRTGQTIQPKSVKNTKSLLSQKDLEDNCMLYQNNPNPFSQSTTIEYFLPDDAENAMICIYDMNGKQLRCFRLENCGYGNIEIVGSDLDAGMYMYSLIVNGQLVYTKRMVLTE